MPGPRPAALAFLGTTALAAVIAAAHGTASAQTLRPTLRQDDGPLPRIRAPAPRRATPAPQPSATDLLPQPRLRPTGDDSPAAGTPPSDNDPDVSTEPPTGLRPAQRDGDPANGPAEPEPVIDGVPEEPETYRNPDGADTVSFDARDTDDIAPFERPPAGHDPQAFGVELTPLDDRRPFQLSRLDPWQPRGIRLGTFTLFPSVDIGAAWLSNIFRTRTARSDVGLELRPTLRLVSNWRTHAVELRATGGLTFLAEHPAEDDRAYTLEARSRLDVTRRTSVTAGVMRDVAQDSRGTIDSRLRGTSRADVSTIESRLAVDHRFNRLAIQLRGSARQRTFEDPGVAGGAVLERDRNQRVMEEALRVSWIFRPTLVAFAETAVNQRRFEAAARVDGIRRDSDGERYRLGLGFGNTGNILRGEASVGYGRQTPRDTRLAEVEGIIVDANLTWRIDGLTALLIRGSTDVTETTSLQSSGGMTRRLDAELRHAFMRPLIGFAGIGLAATSYQGTSIHEQLIEGALGFEYYLAPEAVLFGRYSHASLSTNAPGGGWDADEVRIGMRLRR